METPPLLASQGVPARLPRFNLHWAAVATWAIYACASVAMAFSRGALSPFQFGELVGSTVGALCFPLLLAYLAWRFAGRSAAVANAVFFAIFTLAVMGQLKGRLRGKDSADVLLAEMRDKQSKLQAEELAALDAGTPHDPAKAVAFVEEFRGKMGVLAENSTGQDKLVAEVGQRYFGEILAVKKRYDAAVESLRIQDFWNLVTYVPGEATEARRAAIQAFAHANADLREYQDQAGTAMQRLFRASGVGPAALDSALEGYRRGGGARLALLEKVRETDAQLAALMDEFLDFADEHRERWQIDPTDGKVLFADDALLARFNEMMERVNRISQEQIGYERQILAITPGKG